MAGDQDGNRSRPGASSEASGGGIAAGASPATIGVRTRVAARYPALGVALRAGTAAPSIDEVATAAVEHKRGGDQVDEGVAARVGGYLGADFSGVRVHADPLARQATEAMGARAFAYGGDVFLGPGENGGDLGLMAHELTHVAQQRATGQRTPQRQVTVGAADSPAEREADQVASAITAGHAPSTQLIVDDLPVGPGQMLKSQFLDQLRQQVTEAANEELGPVYSAIGCPYIDQYFNRYATQPAAMGEALLRRFAPATRGTRSAADMIPIVVSRVRVGVRGWRDTGQPPPELAGLDAPTGAPAPPAIGPAATAAPIPRPAPDTTGEDTARALRAPDGRETLSSLEAALGPGEPLPFATASRMSDALGVDVASARVHTGVVAARKAADAGALAFAVGPHIVLGGSAPAAGTLEGDALLAHELAHTAQQAGAAGDPVARRKPIGGEDAGAEAAADTAAASALVVLHGTAAQKASAARSGVGARTGLQLQRCSQPRQTPAPPPISTAHGADQRGSAHLPTADQQREIGYDLDPSSRPSPAPLPPPPQNGQPAPPLPPPLPRVPWDGRNGAPDFQARRNDLENALRPCIAGYIVDTRAQVAAAMGQPSVSYATTPAQNGQPANPGVVDIAGAARTVLETRFGITMNAGASTAHSRGERGPIVQGTNLFDPHSAQDRGRLMGGQNETQLQEGVVWWVFQNDNPATAQAGRRSCTQELEAHHYSSQDAGAEAFRWQVAHNYVAAASAAEKQRIIDYRLYNWSERGPTGGVTLLNSYQPGATNADTAANERRAHWYILYTAIHELLHLRTHPAFSAAAQGRAVMTEGFTEMFKKETCAAIIPLLRGGQMESVRTAVEGNKPLDPTMIPDAGTPAEYAPHLAMAERIRDGIDAATAAAANIPVRAGVGADGCRAAYFQGHVEFLGLSSGAAAQGGQTGDPLPPGQLAPAAGGVPIRVPPGFASLDDLAARVRIPRATIAADNPGNPDIAAGRVPATAILNGAREHWVVVATTTDPRTRVTSSEPETRANIAAQHGVSEADLAAANPDIALDAANHWPALTLGQKILVPHP